MGYIRASDMEQHGMGFFHNDPDGEYCGRLVAVEHIDDGDYKYKFVFDRPRYFNGNDAEPGQTFVWWATPDERYYLHGW